MQTGTPHLITQFTEDAQATEDRLCDCHDCPREARKIQKGEWIHYIASYLPCTLPGETSHISYEAHHSASIIQNIRKSVSAAQSQSSINPPPVMPMTQQSTLDTTTMPPPPLPKSRMDRFHGPSIHVPIAWPNPSNSSSTTSTPNMFFVPLIGGYGPQYAQYHTERQCWASAAHKPPPPAQTYSLELLAVYESSRASKRSAHLNTFGSIREGLKDIDAHSTAQDLMRIALTTLTPLVKCYCPAFSWRDTEFVVQDKAWVNLRTHASTRPYFYDNCLREVTRKNVKTNSKVFKTGKQFTLYIVVPEKQWEELEEYCESITVTKPQPPRTLAATWRPPRVNRSLSSTQSTSHESADLLASTSGGQKFSAAAESQGRADDISIFTASDVSALWRTENTSARPASTHNPIVPMSATKRQHHHDSSTSTSGSSALQSGSESDLNIGILQSRIDPANFVPIPVRKIEEIIGPLGSEMLNHTEIVLTVVVAFDIKTASHFPSHIRARQALSALLGVGAFKTTQALELTLSPLRPTGLGSIANQLVAAKRPFTQSVVGGGPHPPCPPFDQPPNRVASKLLYHEANILYWANALLDLVYDYIARRVAKAKEPPPFKIPQLHFVEAGLLFTNLATEPDSLMTYLVEEVIKGKFFKYIHNSNAVPCELANDEANEIAKFLLFTQHVQYMQSGKQVYISDYQGSLSLLTDPQIITYPDIGKGKDLFADGNIEKSVQLFERQHNCSMNKFCTWPGFKMVPFVSSDGASVV